MSERRIPGPVLDLARNISLMVQREGVKWVTLNRSNIGGVTEAGEMDVAMRVAAEKGWIAFDVDRDGAIIPNSLRAGEMPL